MQVEVGVQEIDGGCDGVGVEVFGKGYVVEKIVQCVLVYVFFEYEIDWLGKLVFMRFCL